MAGQESYASRHVAGAARILKYDGGTIKLYNGAIPAGPLTNQSLATFISGATLVASWTLNSTAVGSDTNGTATLSVAAPAGDGSRITATASATGTLSGSNANGGFFVACDSGGNPITADTASLTGGGGKLVFDSQPQSGASCYLTGWTHTESA